jgi:antitoxin MazE
LQGVREVETHIIIPYKVYTLYGGDSMEQVAIRSWGNSQGIRIPKDILDKMQLKISDVLDIEIKDDTIVLKKQFVHKTFEERLAEYNGEITVCDFDWGEPMGREIL